MQCSCLTALLLCNALALQCSCLQRSCLRRLHATLLAATLFPSCSAPTCNTPGCNAPPCNIHPLQRASLQRSCPLQRSYLQRSYMQRSNATVRLSLYEAKLLQRLSSRGALYLTRRCAAGPSLPEEGGGKNAPVLVPLLSLIFRQIHELVVNRESRRNT